MSKILTLAATGLAGIVLGAGIGVAAAGEAPSPPRERSGLTAAMETCSMDMGSMMGSIDMGSMDMGSMDEMHASMRDQMPAEVAEQCDDMHAAMTDRMGGGGRPDGMPPGAHAEHHPGERKG